MSKKILKYGTGQSVPEGAIYMSTVKNERMPNDDGNHMRVDEKCYVWHYFLIEVEE